MSKSVKINGVTYENVPSVNIPLSTGTGNATFRDTSDATITSADVLETKVGYGPNGVVNGGMANKGAVSEELTLNGETYTVPQGYHDGQGLVTVNLPDATITPTAAISGTGAAVIGDTSSAYPVEITPSAAATTGAVEAGTTTGTKITKYIQVETKTATPSTSSQDIKPTSGKLLSGVTVAAVSLTGTATAGQVLAGATFYNTSLTAVTGTLTVPQVTQEASGSLTIQ